MTQKTDSMQLISEKATPVIKMKHFLSVWVSVEFHSAVPLSSLESL